MTRKLKQLCITISILAIGMFGCSNSEVNNQTSDHNQSSPLEEKNDEQLARNDSVTNEESNNSSEQSNMGSLEGNTEEQSAKNDTVTNEEEQREPASMEENIDSVSNSDETIVDKVPGVKHQFLEKLDAIQEELESMPIKADSDKGVTNAMRSYYGIAYEKYDEAINEIYQFLMKNLSEKTAKQLQSDQIQWIIHKEALAEEEKAKYNGGTYEFVAFFVSLYESTKTRCYELVDLYMD